MAQYVAIAGAAMNVLSQFKEGAQARADAGFEARQFEQQAGQERAASQRQAIEDRRQTRLAQSRLQALAGGGGGDPTVVKLASDIAGEGELRALTSLYGGDDKGRSLEMQATANRASGKARANGAAMSGVASALQSGSSIYSKFGNGGFKGGS
jgi:hypothetical protein